MRGGYQGGGGAPNPGYGHGYDPNFAGRQNYVDRNNPQIAVLPDHQDNDARRSQYDRMIAQSRGTILPGEPQGVPGYPYPNAEPDYGMRGYHHAGLGASNMVPVGMGGQSIPNPDDDGRSYTQVGSSAQPSTSNYMQQPGYTANSIHASARSRTHLNQRMTQEPASSEVNVLSSFGITPQDMLEYWSIYFNDTAPEHHPDNVQQKMIISFLDGILRDHQRFGNTVPYIRWNKIGSVLSEVEAFVEVKTRSQTSYDDYGAYDERLWKLFNFLEEYPEDIINALGLILHTYRCKVLYEKESRVYPRIVATLPENRKENDSTRTNRFTQIRGTIICIWPPKPLLRSMVFTCVECGTSVRKFFKGGYYLPPESCDDKRCVSKNFSSDRSTASLGVMQRFLVQEITSKKESNGTAEQLSPPITIEAIDNLVGTAHLNKATLISGIWRVDQSGSSTQKKSSKMYDHYIEANSIDYMQEPAEQISLQPEQEQAVFRKIQDCQLRFYTLIGSFCPEVPGQELVKTAIILSIVGGSHPGLLNPKQDPEAKHSKYLEANFKNRCHLLLLGERCSDKSAMLKYVESLSPNNNYFEGKGNDLSRLTCKHTGGPSGEVLPGLLPLSNKGVCCIEGIDKLEQIETNIIEVIERRKFSVAKKGIYQEYECDATIIATIEPKNNKINGKKSIHENFPVNESFLNKFDMIILFSEEKRRKANMNIEKKNNPIKKKPLKTKRGPGEDDNMDNPVINKLEDINCNIQRYMDQVIENGHEALEKYSDKLRNIINTLGVENLLSKNQIMTFLAHVRDNYHPVFEKEAETDLFDYYFEIKIAYYDQDTLFPVNNRTFEALIKMCQARAKLDCMTVVRSDHVREVKDMFKEIVYLRLAEVAVESAIKRGGQAQVDRNDVSGLSVPKQKKIYIDVLNDEANSRSEKYFSMAELREIARSMKLKVGEFYSFIEELNHLCILIKGKDGCYELRGYYH